MTALLIAVIVELIGWAAGSRIALTHRMTRTVCTGRSPDGGRSPVAVFASTCWEFHAHNCQQAIGAIRDRTLADGLLSLAAGLAWPALIISRILIGTTPRTPDETRRIIDRQAADIERLQAAIEPAPELHPGRAYTDLYGNPR